MFDSICIRRNFTDGNPLDLGFLAEAMIFYQDVHVVLDPQSFKFLVRTSGADALLAALEEGFIRISYLENSMVVITNDKGTSHERHGLNMVQALKHEYQQFAPALFRELTGKSGKGGRMANRYARFVKTLQYGSAEAEAARSDLTDHEFTTRAASIVLAHMAPGYVLPENHVFQVDQKSEGLVVNTNIDLSRADEFHRRVMPDSSIDAATIMVHIFAASGDLRLAANMSAEMALPSEQQGIDMIKFEDLLRKRGLNEKELQLFQSWIFENGRDIRDAVNSGYRTFEDVLRLVSVGRKFKEWVRDRPEDLKLREEYMRAISRLDWVDQLPPKAIRWLLFGVGSATIGLLVDPIPGAVTGLAMGAMDTFLIDRMVKGWKPNQFVEGPLKKFVA